MRQVWIGQPWPAIGSKTIQTCGHFELCKFRRFCRCPGSRVTVQGIAFLLPPFICLATVTFFDQVLRLYIYIYVLYVIGSNKDTIFTFFWPTVWPTTSAIFHIYFWPWPKKQEPLYFSWPSSNGLYIIAPLETLKHPNLGLGYWHFRFGILNFGVHERLTWMPRFADICQGDCKFWNTTRWFHPPDCLKRILHILSGLTGFLMKAPVSHSLVCTVKALKSLWTTEMAALMEFRA